MTPRGYDQTAWGIECLKLHEKLLGHYPLLKVGVGPDAKSLYKAPQAITFGYQPSGAPQSSPTISGPGRRNPFDDMVRVAVEIWMTDPVEAYEAYQHYLIAVNEVLHGRRAVPGPWRGTGGQIGDIGAKITTSVTIRIPAYARTLLSMKPTTKQQQASTVNPAGAEEEVTGLAAP